MSFTEKNAWFCLSALTIVYVPYFVLAILNPASSFLMFFAAIVALIMLLTLFHTLNAVFDRELHKTGSAPPLDELETGIEVRSAKFAGIVLSVFVTIWSLNALIGLAILVSQSLPLEKEPMKNLASVTIPVMPVLIAFQLLFAGFVVANILYYGAIIFGYRRYS